MHRHSKRACAALILGMLAAPSLGAAQVPDTAGLAPDSPVVEPPVVRNDLSGPRFGVTVGSEGEPRSQFGWHSEHQAASGANGPWFIVETVWLVAGVERREFIPSGTLVFGMRLPNDYEFGIGPNATVGGRRGLNSALVIAVGRSFRAGGIRVPVNLALATNRDGGRVSLVAGWAIRDTEDENHRHKEHKPRFRYDSWH